MTMFIKKQIISTDKLKDYCLFHIKFKSMCLLFRHLLFKKIFVPITAFGLLTYLPVQAQTNKAPYLINKDATKQLIVEGKPFLILGGELGNSSASSLAYMRPIW